MDLSLCSNGPARYDAGMILLLRFIAICRLRAGPADVPASPWLLRVAVLAYFISGIFVSHVDHRWSVSLVASAADTLFLLALAWLVLRVKQYGNRYLQTVTSIAGSNAIIALVSLPVLMLFRLVEPHGQLTMLVLLFVILLVIWNLMVTAHILREALELQAGMAVIVTVIYTVLSLIVVGLAIAGVA